MGITRVIIMKNKAIVVGIVAVLVIAAVGGTMFIMKSQADTDELTLEGKWVLTYKEEVNLVDSNHLPVKKAEDCTIYSYSFDAKENIAPFEITAAGDNFFEGTLNREPIFGTFNGVKFTFETTNPKEEVVHYYIVEGVLHKDHISLSVLKFGMPNGVAQICAVTYAMFIPMGGKLVSPLADWVDYHMFDVAEHVSTTSHMPSDFEGENANGSGEELDTKLDFVKSHSLVNLFNIVQGKKVVGVQALISHDHREERATGLVGGNVIRDDGTILAFRGNSGMSEGRITITHSWGTRHIGFMEYVYNVPTPSGTGHRVVFPDEHYEGTVTYWKAPDKEKTEKSIYFDIVQRDNTIYSAKVVDGDNVILFGQLIGSIIEAYISFGDTVINLEGHFLENGDIVMTAFIGKKAIALYQLSPVEK